jgi:hypothetical protein
MTFRNVIFGGAEAGATEASTYPDSATFVAAPPPDGRCNLAILFFPFFCFVVVVVVVDYIYM